MEAKAISMAYRRPAPGPGRLLVDVTYQNAGVPGSGIARVVDRIMAAFKLRADIGMDILPVAAVPGKPHYRVAGNYCRKMGFATAWQQDPVIDLRSDEYFLSLDLNHMINEQAAFIDRVHALGGRSCGIVYDLLPIQRPDWFPEGIADHHRRWFETMCRLDRLACISRAVAADVEERIYTRPSNARNLEIASFHLGCDLPSHPSGQLPPNFGVRPTFLLVSLLDRRKGQLQTLRAFEQLWERGVDVNLAFAGRQGWGSESLIHAIQTHGELGNRLFWFNGPTDGKLEMMYQKCSGVIVASEGEGFGLPVVEALQHVKPVLARDIPVLREVGGEQVSYFGGKTDSEFASELGVWIAAVGSGEIAADPDFKPMRWSESAGQLLSIMRIGKN